MNRLASSIIVDIITLEMAMPKDTVWLRDQNKTIPNDFGLYIVVGFVSAGGILANTVEMVPETVIVDGEPVTTQHQINNVLVLENIQIDILSRSNDALTRNWEVIAALQSFYAQQQQELNNFKIARIPRSFVNASVAEGGSMLNRYSIVVSAQVWHRKDRLLASPLGDYYNDFHTRVDDEKTIGTENPLIEFEINSGGIVP